MNSVSNCIITLNFHHAKNWEVSKQENDLWSEILQTRLFYLFAQISVQLLFARRKQTFAVRANIKLKEHFSKKVIFYHRNPHEIQTIQKPQGEMVHEVFMRSSFCVLEI